MKDDFVLIASRFTTYRRKDIEGTATSSELITIQKSFLRLLKLLATEHPIIDLRYKGFAATHFESYKVPSRSTKTPTKNNTTPKTIGSLIDSLVKGAVVIIVILVLVSLLLGESTESKGSSKAPYWVIKLVSYSTLDKALAVQNGFNERSIIILENDDRYYLIEDRCGGVKATGDKYLKRSKSTKKEWPGAKTTNVWELCDNYTPGLSESLVQCK